MGKKILGVDIDKIIRLAINESLPKDEQQAQTKKSKELDQFSDSKNDETEDLEVDEAPEEEATKKVKAADIVDLFNIMRSGKSLKDPEVRKNFQAYFDALTGSDRVALYSYSKALSDIIAGGNDREESAEEVQPKDYGVSISKKDKPKKVSNNNPKADQDDDSAPIVVGEVANKSRELNILRKLK